jgi:hypothetical protein
LSAIYLLVLLGVGLAILAMTLDSILSVSRKPSWAEDIARPMLHVVPVVERREQDLPFVGAERRQVTTAPEEVRSNRAA